MKKITLNGQKEAYIKAIDVLNTNLCELEKDLAKVSEVGELTIPLVQRFNDGLQLSELFAEKAEEYIAECRPAPLESVKKIILNDFIARLPSDKSIYERIAMFRGLYSWFESQTGGEAPDIVRIGSNWQVSAAQQKRLIDSCTVALSAKQATYISLLDEVVKAKKELADWEIENNIDANIGVRYTIDANTVYGLIQAI